MKIYTVSNIKRGLKCSNFKMDNNSFALEKGSIIHSILSDGDEYSRVGSTYRGELRLYKQEHDFDDYQRIVDDVKFTYPHLFDGNWHIEEQIDVNFNDKIVGDITLSGVIDKYKIEGNNCHILDWKTGINRANTNDKYDMLQSQFYTFIILMKYPFLKNIIFEYVYVEQDAIVRVETEIKENTKQNLFRYIRQWIFAVQQSEGIYRISNNCSKCMNKTTCPLIDNELNLLEFDKERLDIKKIKFLKSLINSIYDERKVEIIEGLEGDSPLLKTITYNYIETEQLSDDEIRKLTSNTIKISKKEAERLMKDGYTITHKQTKALK